MSPNDWDAGSGPEPTAAHTASRPLSGRVVKLTFKRLKNGSVRHWTRVEFEDSPFKSVALSGVIPAGNDPEATLLLALTHRYHLTHSLPEPKWSGAK